MKIEDHVSSLSNSVNSMANDAADRGSRLADKASEVSGQVASSLRGMGINTDQLAVAARREIGAIEGALVDAVRARPLRAIALAGIAGLLIGVTRGR